MKRVSRGLYITIGLLLLAASCARGSSQEPSRETSRLSQPAPSEAGAAITVALAVSDIAVGRNRFAFALLDSNNLPIPDATVQVKVFPGNNPSNVQASKASYHGEGLARGVYVTYADFDSAGVWKAEMEVETPGKLRLKGDVGFQVAAKSMTPGIGQPVPLSQNKTVKGFPNLEEITSDRPLDPDLYQLTIAEAVAARKPFVVVFATPAFCTSKACGPVVEVVKQLKGKIGSRMNYIHVEIFDNPSELSKGSRDFRVSKTVDDWKLPSEPWIFLVDPQGKVAAKFEGPATLDELEPAAQQLIR